MVIYETINKINGKHYIGKDSNNDPSYFGSGKLIRRALKKYGKENFVKTILEHCTSIEHLNEREKHWIKITNAQNNPMYYNIAAGGDGGDHFTNNPNREEIRVRVKRGNQSGHMHGKHHSEKSKLLQKQRSVGRYSLQWFINRYGNDDGEIRYKARNANRSLKSSGQNNPAYRHIDKTELITIIKNNDFNLAQLCKYFNVGSTAMYGKFEMYFNCKNLDEVKSIL